MNRISLKRKATARLMHNSTFSVQEGRKFLSGPLPQKAKDERSKAKARAWKWFSMFVRLRDSNEFGMGKCCTCGSVKHWKELQAGHYVTRAKESTLFDERNVQSQCAGCNMWQGGKPLEFEVHLDARYGNGCAAAIREKARMPCKRIVSDYNRIELEYKSAVSQIKESTPSKFRAR